MHALRTSVLGASLLASLLFMVGCASVSPKVADTNAKKTRARKPLPVRDPAVRSEIEAELAALSGPATELLSGGEAKDQFRTKMPMPAADVPRAETRAEARAEARAEEQPEVPVAAVEPGASLRTLNELGSSKVRLSSSSETPLIFDIPVTYNAQVRNWIRYFQTSGRITFRNWLERSSRYLPLVSYELTQAGLPQDLVYVAMIESGFTPSASSHAGAMGMWQFIAPTGRRYGLKVDWWIDERRDFHKSTRAAIGYMGDLYEQFNSWYLVAASYNMGENGVRRLIKKHHTNNFWDLADRRALPKETQDYVPKIIAAMLISKAPGLYGFRDLNYQMPLSFESVSVPGGTDLPNLAGYLGVSEKYLKDLNPELLKGFIPRYVRSHRIRVPKGSMMMVAQYIRQHVDR